MADITSIWAEALPHIRNGVTGVGIWTALNQAKPIACENGVLVLGLPSQMTELAGHLRMPQTRKIIESEVGLRLGMAIESRVIEGTSQDDWERMKRRDQEAQRMKEAAMHRAKAEVESRTNWEQIYEVLSRKYAAVPNKTIPQNRAKFYQEAVEILGESRRNQTNREDAAERGFARCIERVAQYSEVPSTLVALAVLKAAGEA